MCGLVSSIELITFATMINRIQSICLGLSRHFLPSEDWERDVYALSKLNMN